MVDVGFQGLVNIGKDTAWMKLVGPANERKKVNFTSISDRDRR